MLYLKTAMETDVVATGGTVWRSQAVARATPTAKVRLTVPPYAFVPGYFAGPVVA